ncbi:LacI family DNA-binding transcriptional regulator [Brachybacterium sp.]|uniref:LacI family DNA-binding transcriptional regulator n=1 Tax=Brachybacterium sp. TaxID=1891286 RepID=UPI002ED45C5F
MKEIAEHAGVSKATVSRVINASPTVGREIADTVRASIAELGYRPSLTARSLSLGVSRTLGVVAPDLSNPMFHRVFSSLQRAAAGSGYRVLVAETLEDASLESSTAIDIRNRTDAIVLVAPRMDRLEMLELLPTLQPVAVVNRTTGGQAVVARVDYAQGVVDLVAHLRELGHRRLLFLSGPESSRSNQERLAGLESARAADPDLRIDVMPCGHGFDDGYRCADSVRTHGATGVIAFNDVVALGLMGKLLEDGVSVPRDLSVVGFDDIAFARYSAPPLTTMAVDLQGLADALWGDLLAEIDGEQRREPRLVAPSLVIRGSTAPRP